VKNGNRVNKLKRGQFISIEGIEGVGKSSNISAIAKCLKSAEIEFLITREPGGTPVAENIRTLLKDRNNESIPEVAELLMMFSARSLNVRNVILPALKSGKWVICDRFTDSSRAYQGGGRGLSMEMVDDLANWVHGDVNPDLTILLDAPVDVGMTRISDRGQPDRIESEKHGFFERVRECYLNLAKREPKRFVVIDANRDLSEVQDDIREIIQRTIDNN
jgi:dTMP kinase